MDAAKIAVTAAGVLLIVFVNWYFLVPILRGPRKRRPGDS